MKTIIEKYSPAAIKKAGEIIKNGGLVAFPTETVYGLGADALRSDGARKIYAAKGRPSDNPLIVHIAETDKLYDIADEVPDKALALTAKFWPGPLTIILKKKDIVPLATTGGLDTVAVRMPNWPAALELIKAGGGFIAAPSANKSGRPSPTTAGHVADDLDGVIDMIIDDGPVDIGIESTIVDFTSDIPTILRPGYIGLEDVRAVVGEAIIDPAILAKPEQGLRPKAPGMKYRHYAPKAEMTIVSGDNKEVVSYINREGEKLALDNKKIGIISTKENINQYKCGIIKCVGAKDDEKAIAHNLYRVLREFDDEDVSLIFAECLREGHEETAVMNRLLKAAGYKLIQL